MANAGGLKLGFYESSCPEAKEIVHRITKQYVGHVHNFAAGLIRMNFHDCAVRVIGPLDVAAAFDTFGAAPFEAFAAALFEAFAAGGLPLFLPDLAAGYVVDLVVELGGAVVVDDICCKVAAPVWLDVVPAKVGATFLSLPPLLISALTGAGGFLQVF
ncbi:cationic peroxidase 2-like [Chenopodium quinoa]|uniref:cationic peroxidase 2-like n=1 Tax=Chenopodium quinoa TaxID=63459 RepID=UPI000B76F229|nr:cationic peroxidase 2-like [Chenopodium quinoa]